MVDSLECRARNRIFAFDLFLFFAMAAVVLAPLQAHAAHQHGGGHVGYRLYSPKLNDLHYTTDTYEVKVLTSKQGWKLDDVKMYGVNIK